MVNFNALLFVSVFKAVDELGILYAWLVRMNIVY